MANNLVTPVYLNQRLVFDLLAMLDGGFSLVERVSSNTSETADEDRRYGAEFGLSKALSGVFRIGVSGDTTKHEAASKGLSSDKEMYQTPASLFYNLRNQLLSNKLVDVVSSNSKIQHHDFVEFSAHLKRNPLVSALDSMASMMDMVLAFSDAPTGKEGQQQRKQEKQVKNQLDSLSSKIRTAGETVDIIGFQEDTGYSIVVTLESEYLNDPTMADLVDGRFTVLGKTVRVQDEPTDEGISLLRKTPLSLMEDSKLKEFFDAFDKAEGINLPEIEWRIGPPVFQVIPVCIFA